MQQSIPKHLDSPQISITTVQNSDDEIMVRRGLEQNPSEIDLGNSEVQLSQQMPRKNNNFVGRAADAPSQSDFDRASTDQKLPRYQNSDASMRMSTNSKRNAGDEETEEENEMLNELEIDKFTLGKV